jgi:hypothetical protein
MSDVDVRRDNLNSYVEQYVNGVTMFDNNVDEFNLDVNKYLLIEKQGGTNNKYWFSVHKTVTDACACASSNIFEGGWVPWLLINLDGCDESELFINVVPVDKGI